MATRERSGKVNSGFESDDGITDNQQETGVTRAPSNWDRFEKKKTKIVSSSTRNLHLKRRRDVICRLLVSFFFSCLLLFSFIASRLAILAIASHLGRPYKAVNGEVISVDVSWVWSAFVCIVTPSALTVVCSVWKLCFKNRDKSQSKFWIRLIISSLVEVLQSVGTLLLVFLVLPSFRPVSGALLLSLVGVIPSLLAVFADWGTRHVLWNVLNSIIGATYVVVVVVASYVVYDTVGLLVTITLPLAIVMISIKWWENYTGHHANLEDPLQTLIVSFVNILLSFFGVIIIFGYSDDAMCVRTLFYLHTGFSSCSIFGSYDLSTHDISSGACLSNIQFLLAAASISGSFLSYVISVAACKARLHVLCFSLPIVMSLPATIGALTLIYNYNSSTFSMCLIKDTLLGNGVRDVIGVETALLISCVSSWILFCLVTRQVWILSDEVMARRDKLFTEPMYCNVLLVESIALSRRRASHSLLQKTGDSWTETETHRMAPKVMVCATMWHETELEMSQVLQSIYRLDTDRYARSLVQERDYGLEVHIFLDDAFESGEGGSRLLNRWCRQLIRVVRETHLCLREKNPAIRRPHRPVVSETPFGGRLVWRLPGGTPLSLYLKDRTRVRHKKRWSQVMYMYYLLGYRMSSRTDQGVQQGRNTFILALDGDVDFQEEALCKLLDRMSADPEVGAACGRIHPVGTGFGPILWYQKFEYAVSHWLQKATEHVTGCVLCSPGCFSLFRASALMDKDVLRKYVTPSTQSQHFVQYDQGEDRWLCTLLLQRGHRIEYCAASDSFTFAPEAFGEFFNQRKRWSPSTMSNTIDLLTNWRHLTKKNNNISSLFLLYQTALMVCLLFTPGTIFLLILGAITLAFPAIPLYGALIFNLILVGSFILVCLKAPVKTQIQYAGLLCVFYILSMMVVLVGLLLQAAKHGVCSTTTSFLIGLVGIFFTAALLHPQEFSCIIAGVIFFFFTPTMSMLLTIYSLCNLDNISWGTREEPVAGKLDKQRVVRWRNMADYLCRCLSFNSESEDKIIGKLERIERMVETPERKGSDQQNRNNPPRRRWTEDTCFRRARQRNEQLEEEESQFWKELLEKYLSPEVGPVKHQDKVRQDLKELRNKVCLLFLVANSLLIVLVVTLQMNQGLSIQLPCSVGHFVGEDFEPISVVFMLVFGILLVIQFFGMLWHRLTTFIHIMATTEIPNPFKRRDRRKSTSGMGEDETDAGPADDDGSGDVDGETKVRIIKYLLHHNLYQDQESTARESDQSSDSEDETAPVFDKVRDRLCEDIDISERGDHTLFKVAKKLQASQSCIKKIFGHMNQNPTSRFANLRKANRRAAPKTSKVQKARPTHLETSTSAAPQDKERSNRRDARNRVSPTSHQHVPVNSAAVSVHRTSEFRVLGSNSALRGAPSVSSSDIQAPSVQKNAVVNVDKLNNETKL